MLDPADARWIKSTANELNNLLQVIADSSELLAERSEDDPGTKAYLGMLRDSIARATLVTRSLSDRVGGSPTERIATPLPPKAVESPRLFPVERMPQPISIPAAASVTIHNPGGERELLMIVDDEEFVTLLASEVLSSEGYRVITAKDGFQAIDIYRRLKNEVSLVILDFTMPVMDGSDVFAELQQINPGVSVVLSSGFAEQDRLRNMLARGLRGFIPKPYTSQKLLDQVRQTLDALQVDSNE